MTRRSVIQKLIFISALLFLTLACRAVTGMLFPQTKSPEPLPQIDAPTEAPVFQEPAASTYCPGITNKIMEVANSYSQSSNTVDNGSRNNDSEQYLVTYQVSGNEISNPQYEKVPSRLKAEQKDITTQQDVWDYFTALIPLDQRQLVTEYSVMTDGKDNLLAAVTQTNDDPNHWALEVDIADVSDTYNLTYTLVHEFGHLLTLNPSQVPPSIAIFNNPEDDNLYLKEVAACLQYFPGEGCSQPDSYINAFYNKFWTDIHAEWLDINQEENDNVYYNRLDEFYIKYQDQFVNDYAVTNPEEDIAESWSFFVLGPKPKGDTIAEQKVLFFYNYPELVQLRQQILSNLCTAFPK